MIKTDAEWCEVVTEKEITHIFDEAKADMLRKYADFRESKHSLCEIDCFITLRRDECPSYTISEQKHSHPSLKPRK